MFVLNDISLQFHMMVEWYNVLVPTMSPSVLPSHALGNPSAHGNVKSSYNQRNCMRSPAHLAISHQRIIFV